MDMKAGMLIIPGTGFLFGKQTAGGVFGGKDAEGVYKTPDKNGEFFDQSINRLQKCAHTVNKEHKDRGSSGSGGFPPAKGLQGSKQNFKAPAKDAAVDKGI